MNDIIGTHAATNSPFSLSTRDRFQHVLIVGASGTGKSNLAQNLIHHDAHAGRGFGVYDPHEQLALAAANDLPPERVESAIFVDPTAEKVVTYNPLLDVPALMRHTLAVRIVTSFKHLWADSWGPRLEYIFTNAVHLLLENQGTTLVDLPKLLTNDRYRNRLLARCNDRYVKAYWTDEFDRYSDKLRSEAIAPLQNKIGAFANNALLRDIIGQKSSIDLKDIMDTSKCLFVNLSRHMGDDITLLGAMMMTGHVQAAYDRHDTPQEERTPFFLYVDEFQNLATLSFVNILSEARKYRLGLTLITQYLQQVSPALQSAVLGNVGTLIVFRIGAEDDPTLSRALGLREGILPQLPDFHAYVRTNSTQAALIRMLPAPESVTGTLQSVLNRTQSSHARPRRG